MRVYCIFEKLDEYYDDNDKTLWDIFDSVDKAIKFIEDNPQHDLFYEVWRVQ